MPDFTLPLPRRVIVDRSAAWFFYALCFAALPALLCATSAQAWEVRKGCREGTPFGTVYLLELVCGNAEDICPGPDHVLFADAETGEVVGAKISSEAWLDGKGRLLPGEPSGFPRRTVWDIASVGTALPSRIRLQVGEEGLTKDIRLKDSCDHFPKAALKVLDEWRSEEVLKEIGRIR